MAEVLATQLCVLDVFNSMSVRKSSYSLPEDGDPNPNLPCLWFLFLFFHSPFYSSSYFSFLPVYVCGIFLCFLFVCLFLGRGAPGGWRRVLILHCGMTSMTEMACATSPSSGFGATAFGASSSSVRLRHQTAGPLYAGQAGWATLPHSYYALDYCSPK